jgi:hypothetical protein
MLTNSKRSDSYLIWTDDLPADASAMRPRRRMSDSMLTLIITLSVLAFLALIGGTCYFLTIHDWKSKPHIVYAPPVGRTDGDHLDSTLWAYGYPDEEESTENDDPRPPFVSKSLTYRKEKVTLWFIAEFPFGSTFPHVWTCVGAIDPETKKSISADEAFYRLDARKNPECHTRMHLQPQKETSR